MGTLLHALHLIVWYEMMDSSLKPLRKQTNAVECIVRCEWTGASRAALLDGSC
jgi:hypothetical protein